MTRRARIIRNTAIASIAFILLVVVAIVEIVQTVVFRNYVREHIIAATEQSTGGRVEIGSVTLTWDPIRVVLTNFVIHGKEPTGTPPFVRLGRVQLDAGLFTGGHIYTLNHLAVDHPEANVLMLPDGSSNIPTPQHPSTSNKTSLQTVADLAIRHFDLTNGSVTFNLQKHAMNLSGDNLLTRLWFNEQKQTYRGQISLEPIYAVSGRNTPVKFALTMPIVLGRDRVDVQNATLASAASKVTVNASLHLRNPQSSASITGQLALADLKQVGDLPIALGQPLSMVDLDANATIAPNAIVVNQLHLFLGRTRFEASGQLKDSVGHNALKFRGSLALDELCRLAKVSASPAGAIDLNGTAALDSNNDYHVSANVDARGISFLAGTGPGARRITGLSLASNLRLDPHSLDLDITHLGIPGGAITAKASVQDFARYTVNGKLQNLNLRTVATAFGPRRLDYSGIASGTMFAQGDLKQPGSQGIIANTHLSISPGTNGIPVSGRLNAAYNGASDDIGIKDSYVALPHTRLTLQGSLGKRLDVTLTTHDFNDLLAAIPPPNKPPVVLETGGQATIAATVAGRLTSPQINGHVAASRFRADDRLFDGLVLDASASSSGASIANGRLSRGSMQTEFAGSIGLRDWKTTNRSPVSGDATIRNGDLADVMSLAGRPSTDYSGALSAAFHARGTVANPIGSANLLVVNGAIQGEPFDQIQVQVTMADQLITVPVARAAAGHANIQLTAEFHHPRDSFKKGTVHTHVQTDHIDLAQFRTLQQQLPNSSGDIALQADATGELSAANGTSDFMVVDVNADASARGLRFQGQNYGNFQAKARTRQKTVHYDVDSDFAGSNIRVTGSTELAPGYPSNADASIKNLPVERLLAIAKRTDVPAKGNLSCSLHFSGTTKAPQGKLDMDLSNAVLYQEPLDHVRSDIAYLARSINVQNFEVIAGPSRIVLTAKYDHADGNLQAGDLQFRVNTSQLDLARIRNLQKTRPGLTGKVSFEANGDAAINPTGMRIQPHHLNANLSANGLADQGRKLGDLKFTANTTGDRAEFAFDSNLADAAIRGRGTAELARDYPIKGELSFRGVTWVKLYNLLGPSSGVPPAFDVVADGGANVSGPLMKMDELSGSLNISRINLNSITPSGSEGPTVIQNQGPIVLGVDHGIARIVNLHLAGTGTDVQAHGTASLHGEQLNVTVNASSNLAAIQQLNREINASGNIVLAATARGSMNQPRVNGRLELHNASIGATSFSNTISNANGVVQFNGNSASIQNLTAESGGGKITAAGFVALRDTLRFGLRANASRVRVSVQQGMSLTADANISLTGTAQASLVTGTATIDQIDYAPTSDFGAMLSRATPPVATSPSPLLNKMKLDIQVRTTSATTVKSSLTQGLQANADLRIRGTAATPGALGRINITEGQLVFFNSAYSVNTGTISFFDPLRINPVLNLSLETQVKGVDVVLRVTGPIDNMKLSYTSDPPLQFQEIVQLLATGKVPTSDPTLLANQPAAPSQSMTQMGESAIVSKAIADPVSSQLQRVFGVSQIKIDPTFTGSSTLPDARLTLQQRIASNVTFSYVTDVNDPNGQIIRIDWVLNQQWSAIGMRDQNGIVSVKLAYKKQFH